MLKNTALEMSDIENKTDKFYNLLKEDHGLLTRKQFKELDTTHLTTTTLKEFEVPVFQLDYDEKSIYFDGSNMKERTKKSTQRNRYGKIYKK